MICLKIRTFVVSATTLVITDEAAWPLWFAWKFVPLWYQQQRASDRVPRRTELWFAWKFVPLWYQQQLGARLFVKGLSCDLLENSYLCGISNNWITRGKCRYIVVICLKIRTFVVSATTPAPISAYISLLWFAWKFVPLWYQQQLQRIAALLAIVVICLKIRTFVVSATTVYQQLASEDMLWFAWKFVPLWYQQQHRIIITICSRCCDLLENSYLCGISNNKVRHI